MKIGILGGTFDPPHFAHKEIALRATTQFGLSKVIFIPTGNPWQKSPQTSSYHRYEMTSLLIEDIDEFELSDIEINSNKKTYTVETLQKLNFNPSETYFILGADAALGIKSWKTFNQLKYLCNFIIAPRSGVDILELQKNFPFDFNEISGSELDISSVNIRNMILNKEDINQFIPRNIQNYIESNNLY